MGAHTETHGADIGEDGRASSIGLERIDEPAGNMFVNGANRGMMNKVEDYFMKMRKYHCKQFIFSSILQKKLSFKLF